MKKYLSTMFLVTAITLTLSGCNDLENKQREYDYANNMEQQRMESMEMEFEEKLSAEEDMNTETSYTYESDSEEMYKSLQNADAKLKEILEEGTLSQRLISSCNEVTTEEAEHIDNLTDSVSKIVSTYLKAIESGDKETCDKCNRALGTTYDLYNEIYSVVIGNKIPEGNEVYLVGDIDNENTILRGPYISVFSDKNALNTTQWLATMDKDIFDYYIVVDNTGEDDLAKVTYIVDADDFDERISNQLLEIKEDYSDVYGFNPEDVEIRWVGSEQEGSYGFIDKDTQEPYGLVDGLTNNKVNAIVQDQMNLYSGSINVEKYERTLQQEKSMKSHTKGL